MKVNALLNNKKIDGAKPTEKPYKLADSHGLYVHILPTGTKTWRLNYKHDGKNYTKTFGQYPNIGVAEARQLNNQFKIQLINPLPESIKTFGEVAKEWLILAQQKLKNAKHKQQIGSRLDNYVLPKLQHISINAIKRVEFVEVVQAVQKLNIVETAHRVSMYIRQIMDYAVDLGLIESHSANGLTRILQTPKENHLKSIPISDAPRLFKAINSFDEPLPRLALLFMAATFVRTTELRYMKWDEIKDRRFWLIPESRMKMKKPHIVPLSDYALGLLADLKIINGGSEYVFNSPVRHNKPICENTLLYTLYRLGYRGRMTVHGFRALASTVLNQQSPFAPDVIERQLAHKETDAIRAAYNRAEYIDERIKLMVWWSDWINQQLSLA